MNICDTNYTFKDVKSISEDLMLNILESNMKSFLDWAFLNIGGWIDAKIPANTLYGVTQYYKLLPVIDPSYEDGQVWQGIKKDWVWEKNISYNGTSPIQISNVIVNNKLINKAGIFTVNYPSGKIIFNNAIDTSSLVFLNHSYRFVQVYRSSDAPWFQALQYSSYNTSNPDIQVSDSGEWSIGSHHRVQMPCIIIDALSRSRSRPREIGNNGLIVEQDFVFYILADNRNDRNKLLDILRLQQDIGLWLYDTNSVSKNDKYPLDYNEDLKIDALMYPDLVNLYKWKKCWIKNISLLEVISPHHRLHEGAVKCTVEIIYS